MRMDAEQVMRSHLVAAVQGIEANLDANIRDVEQVEQAMAYLEFKPNQAVRLATVHTESSKVSYWQHREEVYRLSEYEPVQFDIYGVPLGARWETNRFHWDQFKTIVLGQ